jgi:hypothetical protein
MVLGNPRIRSRYQSPKTPPEAFRSRYAFRPFQGGFAPGRGVAVHGRHRRPLVGRARRTLATLATAQRSRSGVGTPRAHRDQRAARSSRSGRDSRDRHDVRSRPPPRGSSNTTHTSLRPCKHTTTTRQAAPGVERLPSPEPTGRTGRRSRRIARGHRRYGSQRRRNPRLARGSALSAPSVNSLSGLLRSSGRTLDKRDNRDTSHGA